VGVGAALAVLYSPIDMPLLFGPGVPEDEAVERILGVAVRGTFVGGMSLQMVLGVSILK
jgi:triosephosphate isomerase